MFSPRIFKQYRDLPIPKFEGQLCDSARLWFEYYEQTMCTKSNRILRSCLFYYMTDSVIQRYDVNFFLTKDYKTIKQYFINGGI